MTRVVSKYLPILLVAAACGGGCRSTEAPEVPVRATDPAWIHAVLVGSPAPCEGDEDCAAGLCDFGHCIGALTTDQPWLQRAAAKPLVAAATADATADAAIVAVIMEVARGGSARGEALAARAAFVLGAFPGPAATTALRELLATGPPVARRAAAVALADRGLDDGRELVVELLRDGNIPQRIAAARALGGLGGDGVVEKLGEALEADERFVRQAAVAALAATGDPAALPVLVDYLADAPGYEKLGVIRALRSLSGEKLGDSPDAWRALVSSVGTQ